jgi:hypothetical protein
VSVTAAVDQLLRPFCCAFALAAAVLRRQGKRASSLMDERIDSPTRGDGAGPPPAAAAPPLKERPELSQRHFNAGIANGASLADLDALMAKFRPQTAKEIVAKVG